jgi:flavin-dependent dehydrogenase
VHDALVMGAGLAGSAAACLLARAGQDVLLLDRETGPHHKVCGEFLSVEAIAHLRDLGVDPVALGGVPIDRIRLVSGRIEAEARLPFGAVGLSRHALDEALIASAAAAGARVQRGVKILELDGRIARTSHGDRTARHLLLATGKLPVRERGMASPGRVADGFVGFKMHYRLAPHAARRLAGPIVLVLFDEGYLGLQMVEHGCANVCLVLRRRQLSRIGGDWPALRDWLGRIDALRELLEGAEALFDRPLTIANLAYGAPAHGSFDGEVLRLGDQWGMTASLTGDGMAIALRSGFIAAQSLIAGGDAAAYHRRLDAAIRPQIGRAMLLQNALDRPLWRQAGCRAARLAPPLLTYAARATRLPAWVER